jgi:LEA14-like dessication related protein
MLRTTLLAAVTVPLAACLLAPVQKPTAEVARVDLRAASLTALEGELDLQVHNDNAVGLPLSAIEWQLSIGGTRAVTGRADLGQTIPAHGAAPVQTSLRVDLRDAVEVVAAIGGGARDYRLDARLHFSTQLGDLAVDVAHQGSLGDAAGLPAALGGLPSVW